MSEEKESVDFSSASLAIARQKTKKKKRKNSDVTSCHDNPIFVVVKMLVLSQNFVSSTQPQSYFPIGLLRKKIAYISHNTVSLMQKMGSTCWMN